MRFSPRLITVVLLALLCFPPVGHAARLIAALVSNDHPRYREAHQAFVKSMTLRGYGPATTDMILEQPPSDPVAFSATVRRITSLRPDLIIAYGASASQAAVRDAAGIPVVSVDVYPGERPPRGLCGVSCRVPLITLLKSLQEMKKCTRIGVLYSPYESGSVRQLEDFRRNAAQLGIAVVEGSVRSAAGLDTALNTLLDRVDAVVVTESGPLWRHLERVVGAAKARGVPVAAAMPDAAEKGVLVSLEISPQEQGHLAADMATRVLEGAQAEHLPLLAPRRIALIVNLRIARELGITVPFTVLGEATRLIR